MIFKNNLMKCLENTYNPIRDTKFMELNLKNV